MCELTETTQAALQGVIPNIGAVHNPIDLTAGYFSAGNRANLETAVRATLADPNVDAVCVNIATTGKAGSLVAAEVLGEMARSTEKPIVVFSSAPASQVGEALTVFATRDSRAAVPFARGRCVGHAGQLPVGPCARRTCCRLSVLAQRGGAARGISAQR
ncbi:hypothetical protein AWV79_22645 [Cupriavidus sp. UYMMa02A]|nr:hypothetical protein AWV79_22645 [Cupriavidus sp. UYMMa02A]